MKKKVIIILLALVLIGSVATLALYSMGGMFLDNAFEALLSQQPDVLISPSPGEDSPTPGEDATGKPQQGGAQGGGSSGEPAQSGQNSAEGTPSPSGTQQAAQPPASEGEGKGQTAVGTDPITQDRLKSISDSITASDKISASFLVLGKLSTEDINYLYGLLEGGLTNEEKKAAKDLCYSRFTETEIEQIKELYAKYAGETKN